MERVAMKNHEGTEDLSQYFNDKRLLDERILFISEAIDSTVAKRVVGSLLTLEASAPGKPITIYQNSPGGEVNSGFAIYDTIRYITSEVTIVNTGLCASIATIINIAAKKQNRLSMPNTRFLIHQPLIGGQIRGPAVDIEIHANEIVKTRERINKLLAEECGQPLARVEKDTMRDYWMNAGDALEYGLIAKVVESIKDVKR
jgi:ATP-dependent Clp protease protease subunit